MRGICKIRFVCLKTMRKRRTAASPVLSLSLSLSNFFLTFSFLSIYLPFFMYNFTLYCLNTAFWVWIFQSYFPFFQMYESLLRRNFAFRQIVVVIFAWVFMVAAADRLLAPKMISAASSFRFASFSMYAFFVLVHPFVKNGLILARFGELHVCKVKTIKRTIQTQNAILFG